MGAIVATIHDLLVTLAFLAFFRYDLSLNVIAAILTVTGYSTNDTIVIFDRVRENLRGMRRDKSWTLVNSSINQTLGRTLITGGTALLTVIALFLFGGEVLQGLRVHDDRRRSSPAPTRASTSRRRSSRSGRSGSGGARIAASAPADRRPGPRPRPASASRAAASARSRP